MERLKKELGLELDWEQDDVYAFSNKTLFVQLVYPHEGTDFKYMLRADYRENFCKWGNCFYEEFFTDLDKDLNLIIKDLKKMIEEKDKMIVIVVENDGHMYCDTTEYADSNWQVYSEEA